MLGLPLTTCVKPEIGNDLDRFVKLRSLITAAAPLAPKPRLQRSTQADLF